MSQRRRGKARYNLPKNELGMNKGEAQYAAELERQKQAGLIRDWKFEAIVIRLTWKTVTSYKPDFIVQTLDDYLDIHEFKGGFIEEDAWLKLKWVAEEVPWFRVFIVKPLARKRGEVTQWKIDQVGGE